MFSVFEWLRFSGTRCGDCRLRVWPNSRQARAVLTIVVIALVVGITPRPGSGQAVKAQDFQMVVFDPPADAPGFSLPDVQGRSINLDAFRNRYVLLNFWATWCAPCVREMPSLQRLENMLGAEVLSVVAVSVDRSGREASVKGFVSDRQIDFDVLLDSKGQVQRIYGARELPSTFLIDPQGRIVAAAKGERDWSSKPAMSYFSKVIAGQ